MSPFATHEALVARAGEPRNAELLARARAAFAARTGALTAEDERRTRAFWDHALCRAGVARALGPELGPEHEENVRALVRAHRGVFEVHARPAEGAVRFDDLWSGATFVVRAFDDATGAGIFRHAGGLCDAYLVATGAGVSLLPGAFFHPEHATPHARAALDEARSRGMSTDDVADALLFMEHRLTTLSRVKAAFAYRLPRR